MIHQELHTLERTIVPRKVMLLICFDTCVLILSRVIVCAEVWKDTVRVRQVVWVAFIQFVHFHFHKIEAEFSLSLLLNQIKSSSLVIEGREQMFLFF